MKNRRYKINLKDHNICLHLNHDEECKKRLLYQIIKKTQLIVYDINKNPL